MQLVKGAFDFGTAFSFVKLYLIPLSILSVIAAAIMAIFGNSKLLQNVLLAFGVTRKTGYSSVIADVICNNPDAFFKIRFKSGGYVIGHPEKYSLHGDEPHLFLAKAARRPARRDVNSEQPKAVDIAGP